MRRITVEVAEELLKGLDEAVRAKLYPNRAEAIRLAIRELLKVHGLWGVQRT